MKATKLPSGNYRCRVEIGRDESGKRIWKSITGPNKKAVEAEAAQFALKNRSDAGSTVGIAVARYIAGRKATLSPSTIVGYLSIQRRLNDQFSWLMAMPVHAVDTDDLQRMVDELSGRCSPKTVGNVWLLLSAALDKAGAVVRPPNMPKKRRADLHIPDEETVRRVIAAARGTDLEIPVLLAAFGPLRRGEICALTLDDIDGNVIHVSKDMVMDADGSWIIKPPKTYTSDRRIVMPAEVIELIRTRGEIYPGTPNLLTRQFERLLKNNDIPPFRFHDLRHFCCSYLHAMNVPDIYIMQRSGHATSDILRQIYTHTLQDQSKVETQRIIESFSHVTSRVTSTVKSGIPMDKSVTSEDS